jgi:hypothetical protein
VKAGHEALINLGRLSIARVETLGAPWPRANASLAAFIGRASLSPRAVQLICRRRGHEALISPGRTSIAACNHFCERPQMASFLHHFRLHFSFNSRCCCQLRNFEDGFVLQKRPGAPPSLAAFAGRHAWCPLGNASARQLGNRRWRVLVFTSSRPPVFSSSCT